MVIESKKLMERRKVGVSKCCTLSGGMTFELFSVERFGIWLWANVSSNVKNILMGFDFQVVLGRSVYVEGRKINRWVFYLLLGLLLDVGSGI